MFKFVSYTSQPSTSVWTMPFIFGLCLILFGFLILMIPELLEILVASVLILAGIGLVFTGIAVRNSARVFESFRDPFHNASKRSVVVDSVEVE